jgi:lipopolysaccharide biosynthesis protein
MKTIAFYLPQYHPIQENNEWWGAGFTEWTNVAAAKPRFKGHNQPHIPADLGFCDLRLEETRILQAELAKQYGIGGFCYYHYWFNGKMLLERPFNEVLRSGKPDFPFCLCWANENWTRRWDGRENEILMGQSYHEYDAERHMLWLEQAFSDERYIKVNGKPLFLVYRAADIPDISDKILQWRAVIEKKGYLGLYVCSVKNVIRSIPDETAIAAGFDAVVEFQPNFSSFPRNRMENIFRKNIPNIYNSFINLLGLQKIFSLKPSVKAFNYESVVQKMLKSDAKTYKFFPCVTPHWDNTPRKKTGAIVVQNDNPELYKKWLINACGRVRQYSQDEQIVFINAWNEWGEGCHLEPDLRNGRKFLQATKDALEYVKNIV